MKATAVHYAGGLKWTNKNGARTTILAGWAACCSGDRAERIRAEGRHTYEGADVTCRSCRIVMSRATQAPRKDSGNASKEGESK